VIGEDDAALIARIVERCHESATAEAVLCARYKRRVYLYGLKHLRDTTAADDLVQDVLVTVIERVRAGAVNEPERFGSFVLGTCRMHAIARKRSETRRARILAMYEDPRIEGAKASSSSSSDASLDLPRVRDCLATLADRDRAVLLLSFYAATQRRSVVSSESTRRTFA